MIKILMFVSSTPSIPVSNFGHFQSNFKSLNSDNNTIYKMFTFEKYEF